MLSFVRIVEADPAVRRHLREQLQSLGTVQVVGEAADPRELERQTSSRPDAVFVGIPEGQGAEEALAALTRLPQQLPGVPVIATGPGHSADLVIRALRAGAVEFVRQPPSKEDLLAALAKIGQFRSAPVPERAEQGRITAVYAIRGGLGVTTLATNLAVSLAKHQPGNVVLADFDIRQGGVATLLNMQPSYSTLDAFGHAERLDEAFLRGLLLPHPSGLLVLPAPPEVSRGGFDPVQVRAGLEFVRGIFNHIVLDLPHDVEPGTIAALEAADQILFVVALNVAALRAGAAGLAALRHLGIPSGKIKIVVARADAREGVNLKGAREALGMPIFWRIPNDYPTVIGSVNEGQPLVLTAARSEIARNIEQLGARLVRAPQAADAERRAGWMPSLRRLLTRGA